MIKRFGEQLHVIAGRSFDVLGELSVEGPSGRRRHRRRRCFADEVVRRANGPVLIDCDAAPDELPRGRYQPVCFPADKRGELVIGERARADGDRVDKDFERRATAFGADR